MSYEIRLTDEEFSALLWLGRRYETSELLLRHLSPLEEEPDAQGEIVYMLEEWQAWELADAAERQDGGPWLPCIEGTLQDKWLAFLSRIV